MKIYTTAERNMVDGWKSMRWMWPDQDWISYEPRWCKVAPITVRSLSSVGGSRPKRDGKIGVAQVLREYFTRKQLEAMQRKNKRGK